MSVTNCTVHTSVADFLNSSEESLLKSEAEHNLILGLTENLKPGLTTSELPLMISVLQNSRSVGQAIRSSPDKPLAISKMDSEAATLLAEFVIQENIPLKAVTGPIESAQSFVRSWLARTGKEPALLMHLGVYELERVLFPTPDGRSLIPVRDVNREIALEYVLGFHTECFPHEKEPHRLATASVDRHSQLETLFFWKGADDAQPVSMAANSRNTRNGATISLVYTPPQFRGMGYASRIVAALSDRCLKSGKKFCTLFTDLANPTSNSIYQRIGYRKIGESMNYSLPPL